MLSALSTIGRDIRWKKKEGDKQANKVYFAETRQARIPAPLRLVLPASVHDSLHRICRRSLPLHLSAASHSYVTKFIMGSTTRIGSSARHVNPAP